MPSPLRATLLAAALLACSCGGARAPTPRPPGPATASSAGGAPASSPSAASTPFLSSNVPMAPMPPPFQLGSQKAEKKEAPACPATWRPASANLAVEVTSLARACDPSSKMHALGAPITGTQGQGAPAQRYPLKADANRCYRVFAALAPGIKTAELMVVDSTGAVAIEAHGTDPHLDGAVCFRAADAAQVVVSVGAGEGGYALSIWSD